MPLKKAFNINTAQKFKLVRIEMYNLQTRLKRFEDQEKAKKVLNS